MKPCIKCKIPKELDQFYKHYRMKDGHLNKCIFCCKEDAQIRWNKRMLEEDFRNLIKERKRKYAAKVEGYHGKKSKKYRNLYPEKYKAHIISQRVYLEKDYQKHHWSYNEKHFLDFIPLYYLDHAYIHKFIKYDSDEKMFRIKENNVLLNSKEKHINYIKKILNVKNKSNFCRSRKKQSRVPRF